MCADCCLWSRITLRLKDGTKRPLRFGHCTAPVRTKPWPYWRKTADDAVATHQTHGAGCAALTMRKTEQNIPLNTLN